MRQSGRYLPEYQELKQGADVLEMAKTPGLAVEATLLPLRRMEVDAAILFSDIMVPIEAVGVDVQIRPGSGPVVAEPLRSRSDVERLRPLVPEADVPFVLEAIRTLRKELDVPLIGFSGAPFTIASYLVEGGASRTHATTKALMHREPETWFAMMLTLGESILVYLRAQVDAGAQAVQVFDSWVGALDPDDYTRFVLPTMRDIFEGLADLDVPRIHFGVGTGELLPLMRDAGADVVGVDWRVPLHQAWERIGYDVAIQGNLDPVVLFADHDEIVRQAGAILHQAAGRPGHIFNVGHGILPETPLDNVAALVDMVHGWRQ